MLPEMKNVSPDDKEVTCGSGEYKDRCAECSLYKKTCLGCGSYINTCEQGLACGRGCSDCGGGPPLRYTGTNIPSICRKSPYRDLYLSQVAKQKFSFTPRPLIELKTRAIIVNQGSPGRYRDGEGPYPEELEAVAVNLRHVWSSRGWFSTDMKDYLRVPSSAKLILLTATHDDVLNRAWEAELYDERFKHIGFDYWTGLDFSQYTTYSKFCNIWESYRSLRAIEASKAHFCLYGEIGSLSPELLSVYQQCASAVPQTTINLQLSVNRGWEFRMQVAGLKQFARLSGVKAIWFLGVVSASVAYNLQLNLPGVECYFLAVNPWVAAFKGDLLSLSGKLAKSALPRRELVLQNQRNYGSIINDAVRAAKARAKKT